MAHHTIKLDSSKVTTTYQSTSSNSQNNRIWLNLSNACSVFNNIPSYSIIDTTASIIYVRGANTFGSQTNVQTYLYSANNGTNLFQFSTMKGYGGYNSSSPASSTWSLSTSSNQVGRIVTTNGVNVGDLLYTSPHIYCFNDKILLFGSRNWVIQSEINLEYSTPHVVVTTSVNNASMGTISGAGTYDYDKTGITIQATPNTGYSFSGWSGAASGTTNPLRYSASQLIDAYDASKSFQATFTPNTYTVTFNANGGSVSPTSTTVIFNNTYGTLPTPSRTGYTFDGWYTSIDGGTKITSSTTVSITTNQTLYARWIAKTPTVTFDPAGGSVSPSINTVIYGNKYGTLPTPTKTGYTFTGWYYNNTKIESSTKVSVESNHTLIAHWDPIPYTITFVSDNTIIKTTLINYGDKYKDFPTVNKDGYIFNGWKYALGATITSNSNMFTAENHTLSADWTPFSYTVIFYGNGDNGANSMTQQSFQYHKDQKLTKNAFLKPGYQFIGWNTEADGTGQSFSDEQQMKDFKPNTNGQIIHLYAQWLFAAVHNIKIDNSAVIGAFLDTTRIIKILIDKTIVYTQ